MKAGGALDAPDFLAKAGGALEAPDPAQPSGALALALPPPPLSPPHRDPASAVDPDSPFGPFGWSLCCVS